MRSGFGLILPGLPLYLRAHHLPIPDLGLASAAYMACGIVGMAALAPLVDRFGHGRGLVGGALLYALGALVLLLLPSAPSLLVGRALQGLAMALYTPATFAYVGARVPAARRGGAYGTVASAQMAGFILGPAVGGVALGLGGPAGPLAAAAAAAALALVNALVLPAEGGEREETAHASGARALAAPFALLAAAPWGLGFLAYTAGQQIPTGVYDSVWSLFMFHLGAPAWLVGASYAAWALPLVFLSPLVGRAAPAQRAEAWMALGGAVTAAAAVGYAFLRDPYAVTALSFLEGAGSAAVLPLSQVYLAGRVPAHRLAGVQGLAGATGQGAALLAAVASGYTFPLRPWAPFLLAAVGAGLGTLAFVRMGGGGRVQEVAVAGGDVPTAL